MQYRHFKFLDWRRAVYAMLFDWSIQNSIIIFSEYNEKFEHCRGKAALYKEILAVLNAVESPCLIGPTVGDDETNFLRAFEMDKRPRLSTAKLEQCRFSRTVFHSPNTVSRAGKRNARMDCRVHPFEKKTNVYCVGCGVFLCPGRCFTIFHSVKNYKALAAKYLHLFR